MQEKIPQESESLEDVIHNVRDWEGLKYALKDEKGLPDPGGVSVPIAVLFDSILAVARGESPQDFSFPEAFGVGKKIRELLEEPGGADAAVSVFGEREIRRIKEEYVRKKLAYEDAYGGLFGGVRKMVYTDRADKEKEELQELQRRYLRATDTPSRYDRFKNELGSTGQMVGNDEEPARVLYATELALELESAANVARATRVRPSFFDRFRRLPFVGRGVPVTEISREEKIVSLQEALEKKPDHWKGLKAVQYRNARAINPPIVEWVERCQVLARGAGVTIPSPEDYPSLEAWYEDVRDVLEKR